MRTATNQWPDERIEELKRRLGDGETMAEAAAAMGLTRNAVIGKASRLGLTSRVSAEQQRRKNERAAARRAASRMYQPPRKESVQAPSDESEIVLPVQIGPGIPFADLRPFSTSTSNECRFIAAEPPGPDYISCGAPTPPGESYCNRCYWLTRANLTNTQAERAEHIRLGQRQYLASRRKAA